jgi:hypothetical protein
MPLTRRLLVPALAFMTLSLSPLESFAGPLQEAIHQYPPDWLTRTGRGPAQKQLGMSCGGKLLMGLGIGAAVGAGYVAFLQARGAEASHEAALSIPLVFGVFGTTAAYNRCR